MKKILSIIGLSALLMVAFSCAEKEMDITNIAKEGFVEVQFDAVSNPVEAASKATLNPEGEDAYFTAAWENDDEIGVYYYNGNNDEGITEGIWNGSVFVADLPTYTGNWRYDAVFPMPDTENDNKVEFGSARKQNGNAYNSQYDLMEAEEVWTDNAPAGKDDEGNNIQFHFSRVTALAYFHLTSSLADPITKATLTVTGGYIANTDVKMNDSQKFVFGENVDGDRTITITFPDSAPTADDFQLWFNVDATSYTSMSLTVETATKTCTISKSTSGEYKAGKLYKVNKTIEWTAKKVDETITENFTASNATSNCYSCSSSLDTDGNMDGFDYTWNWEAATSNKGYVWQNGIRLGNGDYTGTISNDDMLADISAGEGFTVKVYAAQWRTDGGNISVEYNGTSKDEAPANDAITTTSNEYSAEDFTKSNDFTFTKVEGQNTLTVASTSKRILIDKIEIVYSSVVKQKLATPENLAVSGMTVSWSTVTGAASYKLTIGSSEYEAMTATSYTFTGDAGYYDVSVYAIPTDTENYKNSDATTLTKAQFGTPKLATPELSSNGVTETTVSAKWSAISFATNGYHCELYNGETKIDEQNVIDATNVTFSDLTKGTTYTVKVNAIAVTEDYPYDASDVAEIDLATEELKGISTIKGYATSSTATSFNTITLTDAVVTAIDDNKKQGFIQDDTGGIYFFLSEAADLVKGSVINGPVSGNVIKYSGVKEITSLTLTAATVTTGGTLPLETVTVADLNEDFEKYEYCRIKIEAATVTGVISGSSDKSGTLKQNENTVNAYASLGNVELLENSVADIICFPSYHNSDQQVIIWNQTDVTLTSCPGIITVDESKNVNKGKTVNLEAIVNSGATLSYSSSDESIATVDASGTVTGVAAGTATITITAPATGIYTQATATCTIGVTDASASSTVTYTVSSTSAVTTSGTAPSGSSATYTSTYTSKCQLTSGNSMTLTLSGFSGKTITGIKLSMRSNKSSGAGTFSAKVGDTSIAGISSATAFNKWYDSGSYSTSYKDINVTLTNTTKVVGDSENIVITIAATVNSLYCQSFEISYK